MTKMINNDDNFVRLYKSQGLTLKACPHCGNLLQHQFYPGVMARVFCPFGCGSAVVALKHRRDMTDAELAAAVVKKWNAGEWEE